MADLKIYSQSGKEVGTLRLKAEFWDGDVHAHALYLVLRRQLAARRAGTHDTKTRSEVSGGGKKPWRQKGTGRARHGSNRSPLWRHGGVIFGPHPRKHGFSLPQQVRLLALRSALCNLVKDQKLIVLDKLELKEAKSKVMAEILKNLKADQALILAARRDQALERAARNLSQAKVLPLSHLNVHDLLRFKKVVATQETLAALEEAVS